jgi:putative SOS response-associated peptidase YedK
MCGRFLLVSTSNVLVEAFALTDGCPELLPRYNSAPTQAVAVVRATPSGRELVLCRWGLIPPWSSDGKHASINARVATAHAKTAFCHALRQRRGLVRVGGQGQACIPIACDRRRRDGAFSPDGPRRGNPPAVAANT